ncbi:GNAT family N-acetyltransferase [Pseudoduganella violacea]|uniref:Ribosomal protein S18 acetylase RimI-like enzyme n=1 Tax=Pseudoduganella violacea TaxID=1715466 RepID=A0A7W5B8F8_9BURK|nr:GNAT family N-acetyltransferase [Pseudoduganella violacea]MBB3118331.1 ribosomal protein S18 acetylase RimI-like enzyme [Pseudoduganella violacea]
MDIKRLSLPDAAAFQDLRVYALRESPAAFGSSLEEEQERPQASTEAFLSAAAIFGAFADGALLGTAALLREPRQKESHRAALIGVYVRPEQRGRGLARRLAQTVVDHARSLPDLRLLTLDVTETNTQAIALYESLGFQRYGVLPEATCVDGVFYGQVEMVCRLSDLPPGR